MIIDDLEIRSIEYQDAKVGDELIISRKGNTSKVVKVESWETKSSLTLMYRLTFANGDQHYGWADRTLKKIN